MITIAQPELQTQNSREIKAETKKERNNIYSYLRIIEYSTNFNNL